MKCASISSICWVSPRYRPGNACGVVCDTASLVRQLSMIQHVLMILSSHTALELQLMAEKDGKGCLTDMMVALLIRVNFEPPFIQIQIIGAIFPVFHWMLSLPFSHCSYSFSIQGRWCQANEGNKISPKRQNMFYKILMTGKTSSMESLTLTLELLKGRPIWKCNSFRPPSWTRNILSINWRVVCKIHFKSAEKPHEPHVLWIGSPLSCNAGERFSSRLILRCHLFLALLSHAIMPCFTVCR